MSGYGKLDAKSGYSVAVVDNINLSEDVNLTKVLVVMDFFEAYKQFWDPIMSVISYMLACFALLDIILIYLMRARNIYSNKYLEIHRRYGLVRVNIVKVILILFIVGTIHGANVGAMVLLMPMYFGVVVKLLIDFARERKKPLQ